MRLIQTRPDPDTGLYSCFSSENKVWNLGVYPVLFGLRIRAYRADSAGVSVDYCAGADGDFLMVLFNTISKILMQLPEEIQDYQLEALLPFCEKKPICNDDKWPELLELATAPNALTKYTQLFGRKS
jgi:hypothetical protein